MKYKITSTTDGKFVGKLFTINLDESYILILEEDIKIYYYILLTPYKNLVTIKNPNYTINGEKI